MYRHILEKTDHTLLSVTAIWEDIQKMCDDAIAFGTASVCIPPCFVKPAKEYTKDNIPICTVIGFPNGYNTTEVKIYETKNALENGADEIDMVINRCFVKEKNFKAIEEEIKRMKEVCKDKILKVIVETCDLEQEEKIQLCKSVTFSGADFIKTSTGFGKGGATKEDIILFKKYVGENVRIKAAGGISSLEDAEKFIKLGADRLGTSRIIGLVKKSGC